MSKIIKTKNNRLPKILAVILFALVIASLLFYYLYFIDRNEDTFSEDGVNYAPATKDDRSYNDRIKENIPAQESTDTNTTKDNDQIRNTVTPVISAWGQPGGPGSEFRLNGYVPGIIESTGSCTATLTLGSKVATMSKSALQNAQDTSCGQMIIPFNQLTPGIWLATLRYESTSSAGSSNIVEVEIK